MKHKRLVTAGAAIAVLAVIVFFIHANNGYFLQLSNENTGAVLFRAGISDGESFSVSYIHSVNNSPVTEYYQIKNSEIYLTALRFETFGAGMPDGPGEGQTMRYEDGAIIIDGFSHHIPYLCYSIGYTANHTLCLRGDQIPLDTLDEPGQLVLFSVKSK